MATIKKEATDSLSGLYPQHEAENMVNLLIRHYFGMSRAGQQLQRDKRLSESELLTFHKAMERLIAAEPIQYVLGSTEFYGLTMEVDPAVLIPRPETEELVDRVIKENPVETRTVLDVGTGSGCIALALKSVLKQSSITAIDISEKALAIARRNAAELDLDIEFRVCDILETEECHTMLGKKFQIIVSNPPYVLQKEKEQMAANVLRYEPGLALFVDDNDPLLYYRKIVEFADKALVSGGKLYFEINEKYARETAALFPREMFYPAEIFVDLRGKERIVRAQKR